MKQKKFNPLYCYSMESPQKKNDRAVSPVIGVMLMLVVVVIIAAVVSGFSGGLLAGKSQKPPVLNMDVTITNSGGYRGSEFSADVTGVSDPIPTNELKIITSWTTPIKTNYTITAEDVYGRDANGKYGVIYPLGSKIAASGCVVNLPPGTTYHGGAEIIPGIANSWTSKTARSVAPYGFGAGVVNLSTSDMGSYMYNGPMVQMYNWHFFSTTHFGNYSIVQGTTMMAEAGGRCINYPVTGGYPDNYGLGGYGSDTRERINGKYVLVPHPYVYVFGSAYQGESGSNQPYSGTETTAMEILAKGGSIDGMQAMLGCGWENLRAGDTVNVKVIHTPSGATIFNEDVVVSSS